MARMRGISNSVLADKPLEKSNIQFDDVRKDYLKDFSPIPSRGKLNMHTSHII